MIQPALYFFSDDGKIPNSKYPILVYKNAFSKNGEDGAACLEERFESNGWCNSWRNGIYNFHHYHSITHEVIGIYKGTALLQLGGEKGDQMEVSAGDIIIIPAGVGHKNIESNQLGVVGAYPGGMDWDIMRGNANERPSADHNIAKVPLPVTDPFQGKNGLPQIWKKYV